MAVTGIKKIYDSLQDEESRTVFMHRLRYCLDGDSAHLIEMVRYSARLDGEVERKKRKRSYLELFENQEKRPGTVVVYGAGEMSQWVVSTLSAWGIKISALCDGNSELWGTKKYGYDVISPEELLEDYKDSYVVVSPIGRNGDEIYEFLLKSGFEDSGIFFPTDLIRGKQYFGLEAFKPVPDEIYVDAGCFDGETVKDFVDFCGERYKKIYAMEPDPKNIAKVSVFLREAGYHDAQAIDKGAWSEDAVLSFADDSGSSSRITDEGTVQISVISIDNLVGDDLVSFIKMDIEGAELEALKGAKGTIQKHRPKLAICVYHKPEDILTMPGYILEIAPEYKLFLRHHTTGFNETVLYAVP